KDGEAERRLAGAGFADDAERLAGPNRDVDAVDRLDVADGPPKDPALDREPDLERLGGEDDRRLLGGAYRASFRLGREKALRVAVSGAAEDFGHGPRLDDLALG